MHEIYLTMIENGEWLRASIGYAVVVLLAVGLQQRTPTSYRRLHPAGSRSRFQRRAQSGAECGPLRSGDRLRRGAACRAGLGAIRMRGRLRETSDSYTEATRRRRRGRLEIPFSDRAWKARSRSRPCSTAAASTSPLPPLACWASWPGALVHGDSAAIPADRSVCSGYSSSSTPLWRSSAYSSCPY